MVKEHLDSLAWLIDYLGVYAKNLEISLACCTQKIDRWAVALPWDDRHVETVEIAVVIEQGQASLADSFSGCSLLLSPLPEKKSGYLLLRKKAHPGKTFEDFSVALGYLETRGILIALIPGQWFCAWHAYIVPRAKPRVKNKMVNTKARGEGCGESPLALRRLESRLRTLSRLKIEESWEGCEVGF